MPTLTLHNGEVKSIDVLDILPTNEGSINQYYGRIGQGKTYNATADIFDDLKDGKVVYANWRVDFKGYDERDSLWQRIKAIIAFKRYFFRFNAANFHFFDVNDPKTMNYKPFTEWLGTLTNCVVYIDEGHILFDSYRTNTMGIHSRANVLHTRHWDRTINIISQRPTAIHVTLRANVNRFYKCEKIYPFLSRLVRRPIFQRTEFQDMVMESVDESKPDSVKRYLGSKKIFESYSTKHMRKGQEESQENYTDVFEWSYWTALKNLFMWKPAKLPAAKPPVVLPARKIEDKKLSTDTLFDEHFGSEDNDE